MGKTMKLMLLALCLVSIFSGQLLADSYLKQSVYVAGFEMMGQKSPEKTDTTTVWMNENMSYSQVDENSAVIYDMKQNLFTMIDHTQKEYSQFAMGFLSAESGDNPNPEVEQMKQMAKMMTKNMKVVVTPTDQTKKVGEWEAKLYNVDINMQMMPMKQEVWATEDVELDYDMYNAISNAMMSVLPGFEKIYEEMKKIKGLPVLTIQTVSSMGFEIATTTKVLEYAVKDAPEGIYEIPEGYTKVELDMGKGVGSLGR